TTLDFSFKRPSSGNRASISWPSPVSSVSRMLRTFVPALSVPPPPPVILTDFTKVTVSPSVSGLPTASRIASPWSRESTAGAASAGAHSWAHIGPASRAPGSSVYSPEPSGPGGSERSWADQSASSHEPRGSGELQRLDHDQAGGRFAPETGFLQGKKTQLLIEAPRAGVTRIGMRGPEGLHLHEADAALARVRFNRIEHGGSDPLSVQS